MSMTKQSIIVTLFFVTILFGIVPVFAEEEKYRFDPGKGQELKKFELYVDCQPVHVYVEGTSSYAEKIGLTQKLVMLTAEAHLRKARIFSREITQPFMLAIEVAVFREAFSINLFFGKPVKDFLYSEDSALGYTWIKGITGTHDYTSSYVLSVLSDLLDQFIDEYFQANQEACKRNE